MIPSLKKLSAYIALTLLFIIFSCKRGNLTYLEKTEKLDTQKTAQLITQILKDENQGFYLSSSCMAEKSFAIIKPMVSDFDEYVKNLLDINDSLHYQIQKRLFKQFKLSNDFIPEKKILTQKQFEEMEKKSKRGGFSFWRWLDENCENGYTAMSKPIFNEDFSKAYTRIQIVCGGMCGGGEERIYEFVGGKWILKEILSNWIS